MLEVVSSIYGKLTTLFRDAEGQISQNEDDNVTLQGKVKQLERAMETLRDKVQDQED